MAETDKTPEGFEMAQHPAAKAFIKAFKANGGKQWAGRFNPYSLDQVFTFGYRTFRYRLESVGTVNSWNQKFIPAGATNRLDIVMIPDVCNSLGGWLACDAEAKAEFEKFEQIVCQTFGDGDY